MVAPTHSLDLCICLSAARSGPFTKLPCNAFAFCPDDVCFEPDAHHHTKGDCWLKFTEGPMQPEVSCVLLPWQGHVSRSRAA